MDRQLKIIIIDDEEIVCARLKPSLEKSGHAVTVITDSRQAMELLKHERFDIVVTDLKMANIGGMELFRFVKEKWPGIQVVIITGFATVDATREALRAGVRDVIAKPFKINQLKDMIDEIAAELDSSDTD